VTAQPDKGTLLLATHPDCLLHDPGPEHAERPQRLQAVLDGLRGDAELAAVTEKTEAREASEAELALLHSPEYVRWVREKCESGPSVLDRGDTPVIKESYRAALLAAGAVLHAVDSALTGRASRAFCAVRPPGHHAENEAAMGFCIFNNVAVGARYAQSKGLERVAIVDFDVHHGNGTEYAFYRDGSVLYISFHQYPHYPGTGGSLDLGEGPGRGLNINIPLPAGSVDEDYMTAMEATAGPALEKFKADLLMISAGFDAHRADPLSEMMMTESGFGTLTRKIVEAAGASAQGRVISVLEGGYALESLGASAKAHARALAGLQF